MSFFRSSSPPPPKKIENSKILVWGKRPCLHFWGFSSSSPGVWEFRASLLFYPLHVPFFRGGSCGVLGVESSPKWGKGGGRPTNAHFWEGEKRKEEREGFLVKKGGEGPFLKRGSFAATG